MTQSRKFDPKGVYLRKWIPELGGFGSAEVHEPHGAQVTRVSDPAGYPSPILDHAKARIRALEAWGRVREGKLGREKEG